jgi:hypothetical protein
MTALAFDAADGVIVNHTPPGQVPDAPPGAHVLAFVWVAATSDQVHVRRSLVTYVMARPYARHFRRLGFGAAVDRVQALYASGRLREAPAVLPAEMVDALSTDPEDLGHRCAAYRAAGALPIVVPVTGDDPISEIGHLLATRAWEPPDGSGSPVPA